jgi:hypothetical protein
LEEEQKKKDSGITDHRYEQIIYPINTIRKICPWVTDARDYANLWGWIEKILFISCLLLQRDRTVDIIGGSDNM